MLEVLRKINDKKLAKERAEISEFNENLNKGLKFIKKYLKSKGLSNAELNN